MQANKPIVTPNTTVTVSLANSDEQMVWAAKTDRQQFSGLYNKYYPAILKFVYQRVVTKEDAFDITQQVFLQAMLSLEQYEFRGLPFSSWLYRIAVNELNKAFRQKQKMRGVNLEESHLIDIAGAMMVTEDSTSAEVVMQAITKLEEEDFQLLEMRFFEKRPFKEIADILGFTEAAAKMRIYRMLERLRPLVEAKIRE